jgi:flagellar capping protein FliD
MKKIIIIVLCKIILLIVVVLHVVPIQAQISITSSSFTYSQDFDNYNGSSNGQPANWSISFTGSATYNGQGTGTSNTGGVWSYGIVSSGERALGALRSGTPGNITFTVSLQTILVHQFQA